MRKLYVVAILLGALTFTGCSLSKMAKMANDQNLNVTPNPLELHADSVSFELAADLPVKMLKPGKLYTLNVFYTYGGQELAVGSIEFDGDKYPSSDQTAPRATEIFSFPYNDAMKSGSLEVQGVASDPKNGKSKDSPRLPVATGVITTSSLVKEVYFPAYADHGYNNQEELLPTNINFFFDQGRSNLKYSERRSTRGKEFEAFIADKNVTRTVTITGTHSPEGTERINSKLSEDRANVIEAYYRKQMDKFDYKGMADSIRFIIKPVVDDWNEFKSALADYDGVGASEKSEYLNIVNGPGAFEDKEKALRKLSTYKKVFKDIYPGLRSAKTEILTVKVKKSDAKISVLAKEIAEGKTSADSLSIEELLYAASLTPSLAEQESIYNAAIKKSDTWNAHNNLAAVYIAQAIEDASKASALADKAETQIDIANKQQESAEAYTTAASVYLIQGNLEKASDALSKAASLSPNQETGSGLKGVLGAIQIRQADYSSAATSLSGAVQSADNLFNKGLAYLLQKEYDNANTAFMEAIELQSDHALAYYGAAVASARQDNIDKVIENLKAAISNDSSLKSAAVEDLEFQNYAANADFVAVLN